MARAGTRDVLFSRTRLARGGSVDLGFQVGFRQGLKTETLPGATRMETSGLTIRK